MIISRKYALLLVRQGKATIEAGTTHKNQRFDIVTRFDLRRVDHCRSSKKKEI